VMRWSSMVSWICRGVKRGRLVVRPDDRTARGQAGHLRAFLPPRGRGGAPPLERSAAGLTLARAAESRHVRSQAVVWRARASVWPWRALWTGPTAPILIA
jgi:hypothetical protein